jgi:excisionase family DNA binding protein
MNKGLLTSTEVCWELNISKPTLYKRIKTGMIPYIQNGRDYRFNPSEINNLKEGKKWKLQNLKV